MTLNDLYRATFKVIDCLNVAKMTKYSLVYTMTRRHVEWLEVIIYL